MGDKPKRVMSNECENLSFVLLRMSIPFRISRDPRTSSKDDKKKVCHPMSCHSPKENPLVSVMSMRSETSCWGKVATDGSGRDRRNRNMGT